MAISAKERETILRAISTWSPEDQVALAHTILRRAVAPKSPAPQAPSWRQLVGLAAAKGRSAPSDAEVARWLDEYRSEKYG